MDWSAEFPGLTQGTYLNSCAHGLLSRRARAAIDAHLERWTTSPDWNIWTETSDQARVAFAGLVGASPDDIALQANASSGIAAIMNAIPDSPGRDRILTLSLDFPVAPFIANSQTRRGLKHEHVDSGEDATLTLEAWKEHLDRGVALACLPAVASFTGYKFDIKAFAEAAHDVGARVLVDSFQATGTYPIDVKTTGVDFLATGVYKWLMAPSGLGFLYAAEEARAAFKPTTAGWYGAEDPFAFDPLQGHAGTASRYQYGAPSVMACAAATESIGLIQETGLDKIEEHNERLIDRLIAGSRERKLPLITPEDRRDRASILLMRVPDLDRSLAALKSAGVTVNTRSNAIRVSPHFYNTEAHIERFFEVLDTTL